MISGQKITKHALDAMSIYPSNEVYKWGSTLVVAPHPDDETLCCGGSIALLRQMGYRVHVLIITDGTVTHPDAASIPADMLRQIREEETVRALSVLGVCSDSITFLQLKDSLVPGQGQPGFEEAVRLVRNKLVDFLPESVLMPWRRDPHKDHQSVWQIVTEAIHQEHIPFHQVEYAICAWNSTNKENLPTLAEVNPWRLDIKPVVEKKVRALSEYHSQTVSQTEEGNQGMDGFAFNAETLSHFTHPWEIYLQPHED